MNRLFPCLLVLLILPASGCKGTEDYLYDVNQSYDKGAKRLRPEVYDAGQLVHEAFAGLSEQEALTLSQMARAVAAGGYVVSMDRDAVPLLQSQAVMILARLALRYPIPPVSLAYEYTDKAQVEDLVSQQITILGAEQERLGIPAQIGYLSSPDHAVIEKAVERLREISGQNFGRNAAAWTAWWNRNGPAFRHQAAVASEGPLMIIGSSRFGDQKQGLTQAAAVLNFMGLQAAVFDMPEIRALQQRAILTVARQVVVLGIDRALRMGESGVRGTAALAAAQVIDPSFASSLTFALPRERDGIARARIIEALASYPGRETVLLLMTQLKDDDRTVSVQAQRALVAISGEDFGPEAPAWQLWWDQTGKSRWP